MSNTCNENKLEMTKNGIKFIYTAKKLERGVNCQQKNRKLAALKLHFFKL